MVHYMPATVIARVVIVGELVQAPYTTQRTLYSHPQQISWEFLVPALGHHATQLFSPSGWRFLLEPALLLRQRNEVAMPY